VITATVFASPALFRLFSHQSLQFCLWGA